MKRILLVLLAAAIVALAVFGANFLLARDQQVSAAPQNVTMDKGSMYLAYQCSGTIAQINAAWDQIDAQITIQPGSFDAPTFYAGTLPNQYIMKGKIHLGYALPYDLPVYIQHIKMISGCAVQGG